MVVKIGVECPRCGDMMSENVGIFTDDNVVDLSLFTCTRFECEECGAFVYTGDLDAMMEYDEEDWPDDYRFEDGYLDPHEYEDEEDDD